MPARTGEEYIAGHGLHGISQRQEASAGLTGICVGILPDTQMMKQHV